MKIIPLYKYQNVTFKVGLNCSRFQRIEGEEYFLDHRDIDHNGNVGWYCKEKGKDDVTLGTFHKEDMIDEYFRNKEWVKISKSDKKSYEKLLRNTQENSIYNFSII